MYTKIIATIGPKSESLEMMRKLVDAGVHIFRMNFSHCTYEEYKKRKKNIEKIRQETGKDIKIMMDLQGPRIRVGELPENGIDLMEGEKVVFSTSNKKEKGVIFLDDPYLHKDIKEGELMYLANGAIELVVKKITGEKICAEVITGGTLFSRKAVNLPDTKLTTKGLTEKDIADVEFGIKEGVDLVALSFIQDEKDVKQLRAIVGNKIKIISKIERALALKNIDKIIQESDAIMIARGDLGAELPIEEIPIIQKYLIKQAAWHNKASIVATQMMLSMVDHKHPTRAEVSDVANATLEKADAVMLSDETASGAYPEEAVKAMVKIVKRAARYMHQKKSYL